MFQGTQEQEVVEPLVGLGTRNRSLRLCLYLTSPSESAFFYSFFLSLQTGLLCSPTHRLVEDGHPITPVLGTVDSLCSQFFTLAGEDCGPLGSYLHPFPGVSVTYYMTFWGPLCAWEEDTFKRKRGLLVHELGRHPQNIHSERMPLNTE